MERRGSTAVIVAISLTVLLGFGAIAVDIGLARSYRQQLSNAAEASAHAGAAMLDGSEEGMVAARDAAVELAASNYVAGTPVTLDRNDSNDPSGDVVLGYWEAGALVPSTDPQIVTSVQVIARRNDLSSFFAKIVFGKEYLSAGDYAIAQAGGPSTAKCPLPITLADCELEAIKAGGCSQDIILASSRIDNGAWARPGANTPSASYIDDAINRDICAAAGEVGDLVTLNNGNVTNAMQKIRNYLNASTLTWDTEAWGPQPAQLTGSAVTTYGTVLRGQIMVFEDPGNCTNLQYNGTHEIYAYASAVVYDVVTTSSDKRFALRVICDEAGGEEGGGAYFGTTVPPSFVR